MRIVCVLGCCGLVLPLAHTEYLPLLLPAPDKLYLVVVCSLPEEIVLDCPTNRRANEWRTYFRQVDSRQIHHDRQVTVPLPIEYSNDIIILFVIF